MTSGRAARHASPGRFNLFGILRHDLRVLIARRRLRRANIMDRLRSMNALEDRMVLVPAGQLDDLLEVSRLASERLHGDAVGDALRGSAAAVRASSLLEP